jgi:hypothetical protein
MTINLLMLIAIYVIGTSVFYGLFTMLYDYELLGSMKIGWVEFLACVWPVTIVGCLILAVINLSILIGKGAGGTIANVWEWLKND